VLSVLSGTFSAICSAAAAQNKQQVSGIMELEDQRWATSKAGPSQPHVGSPTDSATVACHEGLDGQMYCTASFQLPRSCSPSAPPAPPTFPSW
jgi:hypothetical protein